MNEQLDWRQKVEMQLRDLCAFSCMDPVDEEIKKGDDDNSRNPTTEFGDMDMSSKQSRNVWKTARQFFTPKEAKFLLSASKNL